MVTVKRYHRIYFCEFNAAGTCNQSDCMSNLDNSPTLTFQITMHDGKSIDAAYMCTSIGVSKNMHKGLKDIFVVLNIFYAGMEKSMTLNRFDCQLLSSTDKY